MATTSPARIDDDLFASARLAGAVQSRSASQQVAHWARIGREVEASTSLAYRDIAAVLAGNTSYDTLNAKEQAVVRAEWAHRMEQLRAATNFAQEFGRAGRTWVELDETGSVVERPSGAQVGRRRRGSAKPRRQSAKSAANQARTKDERGRSRARTR